jgi:hypothetical protein
MECHPERGRTPESKDPGARRCTTSVMSFTAIFRKNLFQIAGRRILGVLRLGRLPSLRMTITFSLQSGPH